MSLLGILGALIFAYTHPPRFESDEPSDLLPVEHQLPQEESWLLIWQDLPSNSSSEKHQESHQEATLQELAFSLHEELPHSFSPLVPPPSELDAWLDSYSLYWWPESRHNELQFALRDEEIQKSVRELRAQLLSPFFGIVASDARQDPLGLRRKGPPSPQKFSPLSHLPSTPSGDLISSDGTHLLMRLHPTSIKSDELQKLKNALETKLRKKDTQDSSSPEPAPDQVYDFAIIGEPIWRAERGQEFHERVWPLLLTFVSLLLATTAVFFRRSGPALLLTMSVLPLIALAFFSFSRFPLTTFPFLVVALSIATHLVISRAANAKSGESAIAWLSPLFYIVVFLPLLFSPYPIAKQWVLLVMLVVGGSLALRELLLAAIFMSSGKRLQKFWFLGPKAKTATESNEPANASSGSTLIFGFSICVILVVLGSWFSPRLQPSAFSQLLRPPSTAQESVDKMSKHFFDPRNVVELHSSGSNALEALERSRAKLQPLAEWMPTYLSGVEAPGWFIVGHDELQSRKDSLAQLDLSKRMKKLEDTLKAEGFRPNAFAEFLRGAAQNDEGPSAQALVSGTLGPWFESFVVENKGSSNPDSRVDSEVGADFLLRSRVHLVDRGKLSGSLPQLDSASENPKETTGLKGSYLAQRQELKQTPLRIASSLGASLLASLLLLFVFTRNFLSTATAFLLSSSVLGATIAVAVFLNLSISIHWFAPLTLTIAVCAWQVLYIASLGQKKDIDYPQVITPSALALIAGLALTLSGVDQWRDSGILLSISSLLGAGVFGWIAPLFIRAVSPAKRHQA